CIAKEPAHVSRSTAQDFAERLASALYRRTCAAGFRARAGGRLREGAVKTESAARGFPLVCVGGASADVDSYTELLRHLPADTGAAVVIVNHMRIVASMLSDLLPGCT